MKNMRKLVPAFAMLMVAAIMMSTASFAWFSMGTNATATGMQVTATTGSSLVISDEATLDGFKNATATVEITEQNASSALAPATHDDNYVTYANGLKTVSNAGTAVNPVTGAVSSDVQYAETTKGTNYAEYVVYIASAGAPLNDTTLKASITPVSNSTASIYNAVTVDFWYANSVVTGSNAALSYAGKINVEEVKAAAVQDDIVTINVATDADIPQALKNEGASFNGAVTVVMRVYFDGALVDTSIAGGTTTYVRNDTMSLENFGLTINFETAGGTTGELKSETSTETPVEP